MVRYEGHLLWGTKIAILSAWGLALFAGTCAILAALEVTDNDVLPLEYMRTLRQKKAPWYKGSGDKGDFLIYSEAERTKFPTFSTEIEKKRHFVEAYNAQIARHIGTSAGDQGKAENGGRIRPLNIVIATLAVVGPVMNGGIGTASTNLAEALTKDGHQSATRDISLLHMFCRNDDDNDDDDGGDNGDKVTLLYLWGQSTQGSKSFEYWREEYGSRGVKLVPLPASTIKLSPPTPCKYTSISYATYQYLKRHQHQFDIVHFHEWHGPGYYTAMAKNQGIAFRNVKILTTIHCPSVFFMHGNYGYLTTHNNLASDYMERKQVEMSDIVVSPSRFMLEWVQGRGWVLPTRTFVQQNILGESLLSAAEPSPPSSKHNQNNKNGATEYENIRVSSSSIREIVFFGRLEVLKGLRVFCSALDILSKKESTSLLAGIERISFLGHKNLGSVDAESYVKKRAEDGKWGVDNISFLTEKIQPEAIAYIQGEGRLCVMSSLLENSPYTVLEALALRVPFIVSNVGGIPELIDERDHAHVLFSPKPSNLAAALEKVLTEGMTIPRPQSSPRLTLKQSLNFHRILAYESAVLRRNGGIKASALDGGPKEIGNYAPLVSVCLVHHNRGTLVLKTIEALLAQDYWPFEIVMVDDGSTDVESLKVLGEIQHFFNTSQIYIWCKYRLHTHSQCTQHLAILHTTGSAISPNSNPKSISGRSVCIFGSKSVVIVRRISTLLNVAHFTHADVVTSMADAFTSPTMPYKQQHPDFRWLSIGPAADLGMFHNVFGSSQALVRKKSFFKIGGFSEEGESTYEDWEFFADTVLKGYRLEAVPEALSWYRQRNRGGKQTKKSDTDDRAVIASDDNLMYTTNAYTNRLRALRPYMRAIPEQLRNALLFGWGTAKLVESQKRSSSSRKNKRAKGMVAADMVGSNVTTEN
eukprot:jgi/Bigna1/80980/fgenesh1_pg.76_\